LNTGSHSCYPFQYETAGWNSKNRLDKGDIYIDGKIKNHGNFRSLSQHSTV
jgi:hypothetical protein